MADYVTTITGYNVGVNISNTAISLSLDTDLKTTTISVPPISLTLDNNPRITAIEEKLTTSSVNVPNSNIITIDSWSINQYRSVKYLIQITQGTNYQISDLLVIHSGSVASFAEYGVIETGISLGTFSTDISNSLVRLRLTLAQNSAATVKFTKTSISV